MQARLTDVATDIKIAELENEVKVVRQDNDRLADEAEKRRKRLLHLETENKNMQTELDIRNEESKSSPKSLARHGRIEKQKPSDEANVVMYKTQTEMSKAHKVSGFRLNTKSKDRFGFRGIW